MSETLEKLSFLKENVLDQLKRVDQRRISYKNKAFKIFMSVTVLTGVTTILLGINSTDLKEFSRISALILTTAVTVINAYNTFFAHKELWVTNNNAHNRLLELNFNINYFEKGNTAITDAQIEEFKKTYQEILNELNTNWQKNRTDKKI
jgi:hypothetical protein